MKITGYDYTEWIALGIVGVALFVFIRGFVKKRKANCCGKTCEFKDAASDAEKKSEKYHAS